MFEGIIGILTAFFIGFFLISPFMKNTPLSFRVIFSVPLGLGITSVMYFVSMLLNFYNFSFYRHLEFLVFVFCGIFYYFRNEQIAPEKPVFSKSMIVSTIFGFIFYLRYFINNTLGSWDGFRIWNIKAEFLYQYTDLWRNVFKLPHFMMHNDYPLFLPSTTARLWKYAGIDTTDLNTVLGLIFTFSVIYLMYFTVAKYKNKKLAGVVCTILTFTIPFITNGASQAADIPLSLFILSSAVSLLFFIDEKKNIYLILGILYAGMSAWVKNEGMMFFLVYLVLVFALLVWYKEYRKFFIAVYGAIFPVCILALMKISAKAPNDLYSGLILLKTYRHLWDFHYYWIVAKYFIKSIFLNFNIAFTYILLFIPGIRTENKTGAAALWFLIVVMSLGYYTVYVLSPHEMDWILRNSVERIILQLYPLTILALSLSMKIGQKDRVN